MDRVHDRPMRWPHDPDVLLGTGWRGRRERVASYAHAMCWAQDNDITDTRALAVAAVRVAHYLMTRVEDSAPCGLGLGSDNSTTTPIPLAVHPASCWTDIVRAAHSFLTSADVPLIGSADALAGHHVGTAGCLIHWCDQRSCTHREFEAYCEVSFDLGVRICPSTDDKCAITAVSLRKSMSEEAVDCIVALMQNVLQIGPKQPHVPLSCLPLDNDVVPHAAIVGPSGDWNDGDDGFVQIFQHHVTVTPERIAVKDRVSSYSYSKLDELSDSLAQWLLRKDLPPGSSVLLIGERSCLTVLAFLAILKAGLVYVPVATVNIAPARIHAILDAIPDTTYILHGESFQPQTVPGLETISIQTALDEAQNSTSTHRPFPLTSPNSIGWTLFTSGSTGQPKGVILQQRTTLRLVRKNSNITSAYRVAAGSICAWCCGIGFDASMWELSVALLSGATLTCIDDSTVIDHSALRAQISAGRIRFAIMSTALLRSILLDAPDILSHFQDIVCGGEALRVEDAYAVSRLVRGNFVPAYGLTETGIANTFALVQKDAQHYHAKGVLPVGIPISDSGILIVDAELRAVPIGVLGEILIYGDGLAKGYVNTALDRNRFVWVDVEGRSFRMYRSGDVGRWLPRSHELQMMGRTDNQVKIRGQRVELDEVERAMLSAQSVPITNAVVCATAMTDQNSASLVAYFTVRDDETLRDTASEAKTIDDWAHQEEIDEARVKLVREDPRRLGRDFMGWTSSFDGSLLDLKEMDEWLADTITTVLGDAPPAHILEVGTGSGMLLFNMAPRLQSYIGLEPAPVADWTRNMAQHHAALRDVPVTILRDDALSGVRKLRGMTGPAPSVVVMNSVIQYFPSIDYLHDVLRTLLEWPVVERIVIGDVHSWPLFPQFRAAHHRSQSALFLPQDDLCLESLAESARRECELLLHPSFLMRLKALYPSSVRHVEIVPKSMKTDNELSRFRYTAIIHTVRSTLVTSDAVSSVPKSSWINFQSSGFDESSLTALLQRERGASNTIVAIENITNRRLLIENALLQHPRSDEQENALGKHSLLDKIREKTRQILAFSVREIIDIAHSNNLSVSLSWARQDSQHGGFDAIFYHPRVSTGTESTKIYFEFPWDEAVESGFASSPLRAKQLPEHETKLRQELMDTLPSHMCPTNIRLLGSWPMTANGKIDRRKLRRLASTMFRVGSTSLSDSKPRSYFEARICDLFAKTLGIANAGPDDNFFALGGHSLLAARLAVFVRKHLLLTVKTTDIIAHPSPAALSKYLSTHAVPTEDSSTLIETLMIDGNETQTDFTELSSGQQRLWFLEQLNPGTMRFNVVQMTRIEGDLNTRALQRALIAIEQRHEALRTLIVDRGDGIAMQHVQSASRNPLFVIDTEDDQDLERLLRIENSTPFQLDKERGWRVKLFRCKATRPSWVLSMTMHHMFVDASSMAVLNRELQQLYLEALRSQGPFSLGQNASFQSRHVASWEKLQIRSNSMQQQLRFWAKQLSDSQGAVFPQDHIPADKILYQADVECFRLSKSVFLAIRAFAVASGVTPFVVLLAAFYVAQYRMTGASDAVIGTFMSRRQNTTFEDLVGLVTNPVCIRASVEPSQDTFHTLLSQLSRRVQTAMDNQDVPFADVISHIRKNELDSSDPVSKLTQNSFLKTFFNVHVEDELLELQLEGVRTRPMRPFINGALDDVEFVLFTRPDETYWGEVRYNTDVYQRHTFTALVAVFQETLDRAISNPAAHIDSLSLSRTTSSYPPEIGMRVTAYPRESSIVDIFRVAVETDPGVIAVKDCERQLTYAELDRESDAICSWLVRQDFVQESIVAVHGSRCCSTVVAYLGILKANMAYLPLELRYPTARLDSILSALPAGSLKAILRTSSKESTHEPLFCNEGPHLIHVADILHASYELDITRATKSLPGPKSLAYVLFTSGSTGSPKGVMIEHRGIIRLTKGSSATRGITPGMVVAHMTSIAFDASTWEIYGTLLNGGTLVCIDADTVMDLEALRGVFKRERIQAAITVPTFLKLILRDHRDLIADLALLHVIGERFDPNDARIAAQSTKGQVVNNYGPTEDTVTSTTYVVNPTGVLRDSTPIGSPIENSGALVVDPQLRLVPAGVLGELVLIGDGLARGYVHGPDPRFFTINVQGMNYQAYLTGDRAKLRTSDGLLELHGRMDHQVKVNGQRVELEEVEQALEAEEEVTSAAACIRTNGDASDLVCYITVTPSVKGSDALVFKLRKSLSARLPIYMVPTHIQVLDHMPVGMSGKIDRTALSRLRIRRTNGDINGSKRKGHSIDSDPSQRPAHPDLHPRDSVQTTKLSKQQPAVVSELQRGQTSDGTTNGYPPRENGKLETPLQEVCATRYSRGQIEEHIRDAWAHLLQLDVQDITPETNFFVSGGHSIAAMQLAANVKRRHMMLSIQDILRFPTLGGMTQVVYNEQDDRVVDTETDRTANGLDSLYSLRIVAAEVCQVPVTDIEDIYPCTPAQEAIMAVSERNRSAYFVQFRYKLPKLVDQRRLVVALTDVFCRRPILRTRMFHMPGQGMFQAVLRPRNAVEFEAEQMHSESETQHSLHGAALSRFLLTDASGFSWIIHHSLYDARSLVSYQQDILDTYNNVALLPEDSFAEHCRRLAHVRETTAAEAESFWQSYLLDAVPPSWPAVAPQALGTMQRRMTRQVHRITCPPKTSAISRFTDYSLAKIAWAVTLAAYCGDEDVMFASTISDASVDNTAMLGPTLSSIVVRVRCNDDLSVEELLQATQNEFADAMRYQHTGLSSIRKAAGRSLDWSSMSLLTMNVQHPSSSWPLEDLGIQVIEIRDNVAAEFPLVVVVGSTESGMHEVSVYHDSDILAAEDGLRIAQQFGHIISLLHNVSGRARVSDIDWICPQDQKYLAELGEDEEDNMTYGNGGAMYDDTDPPTASEQLMNVAANAANTLAVDAWDGRLTYAELDHETSVYSAWLRSLGVVPGDVVACCLSRSKYSVVLMHAIWKSGATYTPLDARDPPLRLRELMARTRAKVVVTNRSEVHIAIPESKFLNGQNLTSGPLLPPLPSLRELAVAHPAYLLFTSGSTGTPKGVVMAHRAMAITAQSAKKYASGVRVLQLAPLTFDVSIAEIVWTIYHGACICIAHDDDIAEDFMKSVDQYSADTIYITPGRLMSQQVPTKTCLRRLYIAGEPYNHKDMLPWMALLPGGIYNMYGITEASIINYITLISPNDQYPNALATPLVGRMWIVSRHNPMVLAPVGTVGELVLDGAMLADGYWDDRKQTTLRFPTVAANWPFISSDAPKTSRRRVYRTGDLGVYLNDGTIQYRGRVDDQVKINGQRLELGEIQRHAIDAITECGVSNQSVVSVVPFENLPTPRMILFTAEIASSNGPIEVRQNVPRADILENVQSFLKTRLPAHMIPTGYLHISRFPLSSNGKVDRKKLSLLTRKLAFATTQNSCAAADQMISELKGEERLLARVWKEVLPQAIELPHPHSSFLTLGGDSMTAVYLAKAMRKRGNFLSVADIVRHPRLRDQAKCIKSLESRNSHSSPFLHPFDLVNQETLASIKESHHDLIGRPWADVEDILPLNVMQTEFVERTLAWPRDLWNQFWFSVDGISYEQLRRGLGRLVTVHPSLRVRLIEHEGEVYQVVLRPSAAINEICQFECNDSLKKKAKIEAQNALSRPLVGSDSPLARFQIINVDGTPRHVLMTLHHSIYDGTSLLNMREFLLRACLRPETATRVNFSPANFVQLERACASSARSRTFWTNHLHSATAVSPFDLKRPDTPVDWIQEVSSSICLNESWTFQTPSQAGYTFRTMLNVAVAVSLSSCLDLPNPRPVLRSNLSGRERGHDGMDAFVGLALSSVPLCVNVRRPESEEDAFLSAMLHEVQEFFASMPEHGLFQYNNIAALSPHAARVCASAPTLTVEPVRQVRSGATFSAGPAAPSISFDPRTDVNLLGNSQSAFEMFYYPVQDLDSGTTTMHVTAVRDSTLVSQGQVVKIVNYTEKVFRQCLNVGTTIGA